MNLRVREIVCFGGNKDFYWLAINQKVTEWEVGNHGLKFYG